MRKRTWFSLLWPLTLLAACTPSTAPPDRESMKPATAPAAAATQASPPGAITPAYTPNPRLDDPNEYNFQQLLAYDGIRPIYDPVFVTAGEATLAEGDLVMGLVLEGEAKAYPVSVLSFREMVNDELAGWPVLVTW